VNVDRIRVRINGEEREIAEGTTVEGLLGELHGAVAVELNRRIVPRSERGRTTLRSGDVLEVVTFVGGG
jgi:sulfur carrier protein